MSNWTHVACIFRVDGLFPHEPDIDFDEIMGKECTWDCQGEFPHDKWKHWEEHPDEYLPGGSEGTLEKSVWINPDDGTVARYTVSVFGDLRDHDSIDEIEAWFHKVLKKLGWHTRQACCTVRNELNGERTFTYDYGQYDHEEEKKDEGN